MKDANEWISSKMQIKYFSTGTAVYWPDYIKIKWEYMYMSNGYKKKIVV